MIIERNELHFIPCDHWFDTDNGRELCHATGHVAIFEDGEAWYEYVDSTGELYYGR